MEGQHQDKPAWFPTARLLKQASPNPIPTSGHRPLKLKEEEEKRLLCIIIHLSNRGIGLLLYLSLPFQEHFLPEQSNSQTQARTWGGSLLRTINTRQDMGWEFMKTYVSLPRMPSLSNFWAVLNLHANIEQVNHPNSEYIISYFCWFFFFFFIC